MKNYHPYNAVRRVTIGFIITKLKLNKNIIQKNPFLKKIENKSYAQAARIAERALQKDLKTVKFKRESTYNNRNCKSSSSRRNNFQNQQISELDIIREIQTVQLIILDKTSNNVHIDMNKVLVIIKEMTKIQRVKIITGIHIKETVI